MNGSEGILNKNKRIVILMLFLLIQQIIVPLIVSAQSREINKETLLSESILLDTENQNESNEPARDSVESVDQNSNMSDKEETVDDNPGIVSEEERPFQ